MLQQRPSHQFKMWKLSLVIPALIAFVFLFNVKTVAQYQFEAPEPAFNEMHSQNTPEQEHFDFMIHKDMNDDQLKALQAEVAQKGGKLKWKKIKRNDAGQIIAISIEFSHNNSTASANFSSDEGIENINFGTRSGNGVYIETGAKIHSDHEVIWIGKDGDKKVKKEMIFFSSDSMNLDTKEQKIKVFINGDDKDQGVWISKDGEKIKVKGDKQMKWISKGDASANVWVSSSDSIKGKKVVILEEIREEIHEEDAMDAEQIAKKVIVEIKELGEDEAHIIKMEGDSTKHEKIIVKEIGASEGSQDKRIHVVSMGDAKPLMIVDGKETKEDVMRTMDPDKIDKIEVLKGDKAIEKYGEKGKNGVILITTKQ